MMLKATLPTKEQSLMFDAINRELKQRSSLSEAERCMIATDFVKNFDFSNTAAQHKSAGSWAKMILYSLESPTFNVPKNTT